MTILSSYGTGATTSPTWTSTANAYDSSVSTFASYTTSTASTNWLEVTGYGFDTAISSAATLTNVSVTIYHYVNNTGRFGTLTLQPYDNATTLGAALTLTPSTTTTTSDTFNITGSVTLAQLRSTTFKMRYTAPKTGAQSGICYVGQILVTATYTEPVTYTGDTTLTTTVTTASAGSITQFLTGTASITTTPTTASAGTRTGLTQVAFELWESGTFVVSLGQQPATTLGTVYEFDITPYVSLLSDPTGNGVELRATADSGFQFDAAEWQSWYASPGTQEYFGDTTLSTTPTTASAGSITRIGSADPITTSPATTGSGTVTSFRSASDVSQAVSVTSAAQKSIPSAALDIAQTPTVSSVGTVNHLAASSLTVSPETTATSIVAKSGDMSITTAGSTTGAGIVTDSGDAPLSTNPTTLSAATVTRFVTATGIAQSPSTAADATVSDTGSSALTLASTVTASSTVSKFGDASVSTAPTTSGAGIITDSEGSSVSTIPTTSASSTATKFGAASGITQGPATSADGTVTDSGTAPLTTSIATTASGSTEKFATASVAVSPAVDATAFGTDSGGASVFTVPTTFASSSASKFGTAAATASPAMAASSTADKVASANLTIITTTGSVTYTHTQVGSADLTTQGITSAASRLSIYGDGSGITANPSPSGAGIVTDDAAFLIVAPIITLASAGSTSKFGSASLSTSLTTDAAGVVASTRSASLTVTPIFGAATGTTAKSSTVSITAEPSSAAQLEAKQTSGVTAISLSLSTTAASSVVKSGDAPLVTALSVTDSGTVADFGDADIEVTASTQPVISIVNPLGGSSLLVAPGTDAYLGHVSKTDDTDDITVAPSIDAAAVQTLLDSSSLDIAPETNAGGFVTTFGFAESSIDPTTGSELGVVYHSTGADDTSVVCDSAAEAVLSIADDAAPIIIIFISETVDTTSDHYGDAEQAVGHLTPDTSYGTITRLGDAAITLSIYPESEPRPVLKPSAAHGLAATVTEASGINGRVYQEQAHAALEPTTAAAAADLMTIVGWGVPI